MRAKELGKCDRRFRWISSVTGNREIISKLADRMSWFYGHQEGRELYQSMLNYIEESLPPETSVSHLMPKYICQLKPEKILEIGCGNGRVYRQLRSYGYAGNYTGIEIADYLIQQNKNHHPEANWKAATAYEIPFPDRSLDLCFSLYVLEHLVYPELGLNEMLRILKPEGKLVLVFPDFVEAGRFPSQQLGFSFGRASEKLSCGRIFDAVVSLYDSRVRLPQFLKNAVTNCGSFPINTQPLCLSYPEVMDADVDAIYIASKKEIHNWAISKGYQVEYPCGTEGQFIDNAFMVLTK